MNIRHGMHRSPAYRSWRHARERCRNPRHHAWAHYGGRGITFSEKWDTFEAFLADMGPRPDATTLDRIDNAGNYEPGNCRWATPRQQQNNARFNRLVTARGKTMTVKEWSRETGVPSATIRERLKRGWDAERAVAEPVVDATVSVAGVRRTITEWATATGVSKSSIYRRIKAGVSPESAVIAPGRGRRAA